MKKVLWVIGILVFVAGCNDKEVIKMKKILDEEHQISKVVIQQNSASINAEQPITEPKEIAQFEKIIDSISIKRITSEQHQKVHNDKNNAEQMNYTSFVSFSGEKTRSVGLDILADGSMGIVVFKNQVGEQFYETTQQSKANYESLKDYYEKYAKADETDKKGVLDQLEQKKSDTDDQ